MSGAGEVWALEWRTALRRRRLLAWNVGIPLLLLAPVALSRAAAPHRAAVFAVFVVLFGTFGACIPLVRDAGDGWTRKLLLTGHGERRWLAERLAASTGLDVLQLLPLALLLLLAGGPAPAVVRFLPALVLALLVANLLGAVAAAVVRSLAEGALACAALSLAALHLTGVFRTPEPGSIAALLARWSPFRPLHVTLREAAGVASEAPAAVGAAVPSAEVGYGPWLLAAVLALLALALAPRIAARLVAAGGE